MSVRRVAVDPRADDIDSMWARAGYEKRPLNWHLYDPDALRFHSGDPLPVVVADAESSAEVARHLIPLPRLDPRQTPRRQPLRRQ